MDLTTECRIEFTEAVFYGKYPRAKFSHERTIKGLIVKESYGQKSGQHTFTIEVDECDDGEYGSGDKIRRKGRNVYKDCKVLEYPSDHAELADDKHKRSKEIKTRIAEAKEARFDALYDNDNLTINL